MPRVCIVVDEASAKEFPGADAQAIAQMVEAFQRAIAQTHPDCEVKVAFTSHLNTLLALKSEVPVYPLTLNISDSVTGDRQDLYRACRDIEGLRTVVEEKWQVKPGIGNFWLPVVLTAKGPIYGEAIGFSDTQQPEREEIAHSYNQPVHLPDRWRQPIYALGRRLLHWLDAPPATYLIQFGWSEDTLCFDRLWPFPGIPALASLGVQKPDLFTCHWYCLTGQPIYDLTIVPSQKSNDLSEK